MADRKLVHLFPDAVKPMSEDQAASFLCEAIKRFKEIDTFFGLPIYKNPIGIEVEIEKYRHLDIPALYWKVTEDNSLKDDGAELVSIPLRGRNIDYALRELEYFSEQSVWSFSHRTSVHVHCNVSAYTKYQLRALMAIYACMEQLYFNFVAEGRRGNTFCYPLVGAPVEMTFYTSDKEGSLCTKYCAFNIQPVRRQLTVEFRHLEGTGDVKRLRRWIQLCAKLVGFVGQMNPKDCTEVVTSALISGGMPSLIRDILGDTGKTLFSDQEVIQSVNNGGLWAVALLTKE